MNNKVAKRYTPEQTDPEYSGAPGFFDTLLDLSCNNFGSYITEYIVNAHDDGASKDNNYMSSKVYDLSTAIDMLPEGYKRGGIKLTFKDSSHGGDFSSYISYDGVNYAYIDASGGGSSSYCPWEVGDGINSIVQKGSNGVAFGENSVVEGKSTTNAKERGITGESTPEAIVTEWSASDPESDKFALTLGEGSHIEGNNCLALGKNSHAEGNSTIANGNAAHSEGKKTLAYGVNSHAEGFNTAASGSDSHAEGDNTFAGGNRSHAEGWNTRAYNNDEHAEGRFNKSNTGTTNAEKTLYSVGIGEGDLVRKNAFEIMQNGDIYIIGLGGYVGNELSGSNTIQTILTPATTEQINALFS